MRLIALSALSLAFLAACGEQTAVEMPTAPAEAAAPAPEAPVDAADANAMTQDEIAAQLVARIASPG